MTPDSRTGENAAGHPPRWDRRRTIGAMHSYQVPALPETFVIVIEEERRKLDERVGPPI